MQFIPNLKEVWGILAINDKYINIWKKLKNIIVEFFYDSYNYLEFKNE